MKSVKSVRRRERLVGRSKGRLVKRSLKSKKEIVSLKKKSGVCKSFRPVNVPNQFNSSSCPELSCTDEWRLQLRLELGIEVLTWHFAMECVRNTFLRRKLDFVRILFKKLTILLQLT